MAFSDHFAENIDKNINMYKVIIRRDFKVNLNFIVVFLQLGISKADILQKYARTFSGTANVLHVSDDLLNKFQ